MIGYITLGTADIERGAAFYDALAKEMGKPRMMGSVEDGFIAWAPWTVRAFLLSNLLMVSPCRSAMGAWLRYKPKTKHR